MNLEERLRQGAAPWLDQEPSAPADQAALAALVRQLRQRRRRSQAWRLSGVAALLLVAVLCWPVMLSLASGLPVLGPFIAEVSVHDQGVRWADEHGYLMRVDREVTHGPYTFRIDAYFADAARTTIFWSIHGPDLAESRPRWAPSFNWIPPGNSSGTYHLNDGYLVGQLDLPALPLPLTRVSLAVSGVAGAQEEWQISFLASRQALDRLSRTIDVQSPIGDWTVRQVTLAPTQTLVELEGRQDKALEIQRVELLADGEPVAVRGLEQSSRDQLDRYRFRADPLPGEPAELLLRLAEVTRWVEGGPAIALAPGAGAQVGHVRVAFESLQQEGNETVVKLRLTGDGQPNKMAPLLFRGWALVDETGARVTRSSEYLHQDGNDELLVITFHDQQSRALHVVPLEHAETLPGPFEVRIPLK